MIFKGTIDNLSVSCRPKKFKFPYNICVCIESYNSVNFYVESMGALSSLYRSATA